MSAFLAALGMGGATLLLLTDGDPLAIAVNVMSATLNGIIALKQADS